MIKVMDMKSLRERYVGSDGLTGVSNESHWVRVDVTEARQSG